MVKFRRVILIKGIIDVKRIKDGTVFTVNDRKLN